MENIADKIIFQDSKLKRLFISYVIVSMIFLGITILCVVVREYTGSLNKTLEGLQGFRTNILRIKEAAVDVKRSVETINAVISSDYFSNSSEKQLLMGLDVLKTTMKKDAVTVTEFSLTDAELSLPVSIRGTMNSYSFLVSDIGKLQSLKFPFLSIKSVAIRKGETIQTVNEANEVEERKATVYEINGDLRLPKNIEAAKENERVDNSSVVRSETR
jgi:hypothetical protein